MLNETLVLHSPFDIDTHKNTFMNYLEVLILADGTISYAVPSHTEKMIQIACDKYEITRNELYDRCPKEYYFDVQTWLCLETGAIAVWNGFVVGQANDDQKESLHKLRDAGLYHGDI